MASVTVSLVSYNKKTIHSFSDLKFNYKEVCEIKFLQRLTRTAFDSKIQRTETLLQAVKKMPAARMTIQVGINPTSGSYLLQLLVTSTSTLFESKSNLFN